MGPEILWANGLQLVSDTNLWKAARMFALDNMSMFDAYVDT